eukprot:00886.XXX_3095_2901_1 [CDS] Oithona nana genome sequencing.
MPEESKTSSPTEIIRIPVPIKPYAGTNPMMGGKAPKCCIIL